MHMEVQDVIQFMQDKVSPYRLVAVARAVAMIAPALWGHNRQEETIPLKVTVDIGALLREDSLSQSLQANATQSACRAAPNLDGDGGPGQAEVPVL